jgi:hypothetical protein
MERTERKYGLRNDDIGIGNESPRVFGLTRWRRKSKSQSRKSDERKESKFDKREHDDECETKGVGATLSLGSEQNEC